METPEERRVRMDAAIMPWTALDDRRQRAREAFHDAPGIPYDGEGVEAAIETATRVQITPEIAMAGAKAGALFDAVRVSAIIKAAFEAAGFEVEP